MNTGLVEAICIGSGKGNVKHEVTHAILEEGWGIPGDVHAGVWHRQVSLLAGESIDRLRKILPRLRPGAFAENILTRGLDLGSLRIGELLAIEGGILLEVTQIGKECHDSGCAVRKAAGRCIMPAEGVFARVRKGGSIRQGAVITSFDAGGESCSPGETGTICGEP